MNEANRKAHAHRARFEATVEYLIHDLYHMRNSFAAHCAIADKFINSRLIGVASFALYSDYVIRLVRILEGGANIATQARKKGVTTRTTRQPARDAASFWYLHRCEPRNIAKRIDIGKLAAFSTRLKVLRDGVFVHIDKGAVLDRKQVYVEAGIRLSQIKEVIESLWTVLNELYDEQTGRPFAFGREPSLNTLIQDFERDFAHLSKNPR